MMGERVRGRSDDMCERALCRFVSVQTLERLRACGETAGRRHFGETPWVGSRRRTGMTSGHNIYKPCDDRSSRARASTPERQAPTTAQQQHALSGGAAASRRGQDPTWSLSVVARPQPESARVRGFCARALRSCTQRSPNKEEPGIHPQPIVHADSLTHCHSPITAVTNAHAWRPLFSRCVVQGEKRSLWVHVTPPASVLVVHVLAARHITPRIAHRHLSSPGRPPA